ncbi:MAG: PHP domain-containing protein [Planctomycetota bacterium]|jgi:hypothetical protein
MYKFRNVWLFWLLSILILLVPALAGAQSAVSGELKWYKGNTHAHSWWSDGDSPPELAVAWYKEHGYDFMVLSDHDILSNQIKWVEIKGHRKAAAKAYEEKYGPDWIEKREREGKTEIRLKTIEEFRALFEEAGKFMLIAAEEVGSAYKKKPVHVNAINVQDRITRLKGESVLETIQLNVDAILAQEKTTGRPMIAQINHPNFRYGISAEDLMQVKRAKFFEIYNGLSICNNQGDETHISTERMWDIVLTKRLAELDLPIMYGVATDDTHTYMSFGPDKHNPGRGWVMVRSRYLTPGHIVKAMKGGNFYSTTGVLLDKIGFENNTLKVAIRARPGVSYTTKFIGTLKGYDRTVTEGKPIRRYSDDIGKVLKEQTGTHARYNLRGDEIYVRAKIISTARHPNPPVEGEYEVAWVQPVQPTGKK